MMEELKNTNLGITSSGVTVTVCLATVAMLVIWRRRSRHTNLPPGPPAVPLLGSLPFLGKKTGDLHVKFKELAQTYGDLFHFWLGPKLVVVLGSYKIIKEALVDNAVNMAGRPREQLPRLNPNRRGVIFATYTPKWKHDRTLSLNILKDFGFGKTLIEERIVEEVGILLSRLSELQNQEFDPCRLMQISVSNVICSIVLGKHFNYKDKQFLVMIEAMDNYLQAYLDTADARFVPVLRLLPHKKAAIKRLVEYQDMMLDFLTKFIRDHRKNHVTGDNSDFIHAYLEKEEEADDESLLFLLRDFFLAGTESTSTSVRWALLYMANYPDVQKKVQQELDGVLSNGRSPSLKDKAKLPYTEAVIQEIQRMGAVAPQIIPHETMDDVTISGYLVPKGTLIFGNLWSVLRDPVLWPEPDRFKPERFLTDEGKVLHRPEFIPFSLGRRSCLGEIMARQEMFLYFAAIFHNFNIMKPEGVERIDETGKTLFTRVPVDYEIVIRKR